MKKLLGVFALLCAAAMVAGCSATMSASLLRPMNREVTGASSAAAAEIVAVAAMLEQDNGEAAARAWLKARGHNDAEVEQVVIAAHALRAPKEK